VLLTQVNIKPPGARRAMTTGVPPLPRVPAGHGTLDGRAGRTDTRGMEWRDEGVVLAARPFGETSAVAEVFTAAHGRHAGVIRGGAGRRMAPVLQPGTQVTAMWRARLDDHLGAFTLEPLRPRVALMADSGRLAALGAVCAVLSAALPERAPHAALWPATVALLDMLDSGDADWPLAYLRWELGLLDDLGFGLDLSACAVTGATADLAYVSPRTGRAVARSAAGEWAARLLPLPPCLVRAAPATGPDIALGLGLTAHFLLRALPHGPQGPRLPEARVRLASRMK
jgi:DNA repair protein RecO (recombination protein O)